METRKKMWERKEIVTVDVKFEEVAVKLGKWAGEDGVQGRDTTIGAWRGMWGFCDENGCNGSVRVS